MKNKFRRILVFFLVLALTFADIPSIAEGVMEILSLPDALQIIDKEAFYGDSSIDRVVVPEGVREIRERAFAYSSLKEIVLPNSLAYIAADAFKGIENLKVIANQGTYAYAWAMAIGYINLNPTAVQLSESILSLKIGETANLTASVFPQTADNSILWTTSDADVAMVDQGTVFAVSEGVCTISATAVNGLSQSCAVTVDRKSSVPAQPQNVEARVNEDGNIIVSWTKVEDAQAYRVFFDGSSMEERRTVVYGKDNTAAIIPSAYLNGVSGLRIWVCALNDAGQSAQSDTFTIRAAASGTIKSDGESIVRGMYKQLEFSVSIGSDTLARVKLADAQGNLVAVKDIAGGSEYCGTLIIDTSEAPLNAAGTYALNLLVVSAAGEEYLVDSCAVSVIDPLPDTAVLSSVEYMEGGIRVSWLTAQNASGYRILYGTSLDPERAAVKTVSSASETNATIASVTEGTTYSIWIEAYNSAGTGGLSNSMMVYVPEPEPPCTLEVDDNAWTSKYTASSAEFQVTCDSSYSVSKPASAKWLTIAQAGGTLYLSTEKNTTGSIRSATVTVHCDAHDEEVEISVRQKTGVDFDQPVVTVNVNSYYLDIHWNANSNAKGYKFQCAMGDTSNITYTHTNSAGNAAPTSYSWYKEDETSFFFRVRYIGEYNDGPWSDWVYVVVGQDRPVIAVSVDAVLQTIHVGDVIQMTATLSPANALCQEVTWDIQSGSDVASIDSETGILTTLNEGTVVVRATSTDGGRKVGTRTLTVHAPEDMTDYVTGININQSSFSLATGESSTLTATVRPSYASNKTLAWSVRNGTGSANINSAGVLMAQKEGTVYVRASSTDGSGVSSAELALTITKSDVKASRVIIQNGNTALTEGDSCVLTAQVTPYDASNKNIIWSVTNGSGKATINADGTLTALQAGTVTVTAASCDGSGKSASATVTIYEKTVTSNPGNNVPEIVAVDISPAAIVVGDSVQFTAETLHADEVQLYVDGKGYEKYPVSGNRALFERKFTSSGSNGQRVITLVPLRDGVAGEPSAAQILMVSSAASLESPNVKCASTSTIGQDILVEWDRVPNATVYTVIVSTDEGEVWRSKTTNELSMEVDGSTFQSAGDYGILVMATAQGYSQSQGGARVSIVHPSASCTLVSPIPGSYVSTEVIPIKVSNPCGQNIAVRIMKGGSPFEYLPEDGSTTDAVEYTAGYLPTDIGSFTVDVLAWATKKRGEDADGWIVSEQTGITINGPVIYSEYISTGSCSTMADQLKNWSIETNNSAIKLDIYDGDTLLQTVSKYTERNYRRSFAISIPAPASGKHVFRIVASSADNRSVERSFTVYSIVPRSGTMYTNKANVELISGSPDGSSITAIYPSDTVTILGSCGGYYYADVNGVAGFVAAGDLAAVPLTKWEGLSVTISEMEAGSLYDYACSNLAKRLTFNCNVDLPESAEIVVTMQKTGGTEIEFYSGCGISTVIPRSLAKEGRYYIRLKVRRTDKSIEYYNKLYLYYDVFSTYTDYLYYASPDNYSTLVASIEVEKEWLCNCQKLFDGGYYDTYTGTWIQGIDLKKLTEDKVAKAYADYLGTNSNNLESMYTRYAFLTDEIMMSASYGKKQSIPYDEFVGFLESVGLAREFVNSYLYFMGLTESNLRNIPLNVITTESYNQWFKTNSELDLKTLSYFKTAADVSKAITGTIERALLYKNVDRNKVQSIINGLNDSGVSDLRMLAVVLKCALENPYMYVASTYGFRQVEAIAIEKIKDAAGDLAIRLLAHIPIVGPALQAIDIGVSVGTGINKVLLNIDSVQKAAYEAEYAVKAANAYRDRFDEVYYEYKRDPLNPQKYKQFQETAATFSELVAMEYEAYSKIPEALEESSWNKFTKWWTKTDYGSQITTVRNIAASLRRVLTSTVDELSMSIDSVVN